MAGKRIPALDPITAAQTAGDDLLVIFDTSGDTTVRITRNQLAEAVTPQLPFTPTGSVTSNTVVGAIAELATAPAPTVDLASVIITGGTINGATIGGVTPAAGTFTNLGATTATLGSLTLGAPLPVASGGTGNSTALGAFDTLSGVASTSFGRARLADVDAPAARNSLGLGALATKTNINNGDWSGTPLSLANGGTGYAAASKADLLNHLGGFGVSDEQLTATGYVRLANGLTLQWGQNRNAVSIQSGPFTTTFPVPFTAAVFVVLMTGYNSNAADNKELEPQLVSTTLTTFQTYLQLSDSNTSGRGLDGFDWFAIGV
jgi:hypothetical protein